MVVATALVYADSGLNAKVIQPTGRRSVGMPSTATSIKNAPLQQTTNGRYYGMHAVGYENGKPMVRKAPAPSPRLPVRMQSDMWTYTGARCEAAGDGMIRFTYGQRSCYFNSDEQVAKDMLMRDFSTTKTQRTAWMCVGSQKLGCQGTECPNTMCRSPADKA